MFEQVSNSPPLTETSSPKEILTAIWTTKKYNNNNLLAATPVEKCVG